MVYFLVICIIIPLPPNFGSLTTLYSVVIIFIKSLSFFRAQSLLYFSRPLRRICTSTWWPSARNFSSWRIFIRRSFVAARALICTCFVPAPFCARRSFFFLLRLVTIFVVAHEPRDRRLRVRRDFYQIDSRPGPHQGKRLLPLQYAEVLPAFVYHAQFLRDYLAVYSGLDYGFLMGLLNPLLTAQSS